MKKNIFEVIKIVSLIVVAVLFVGGLVLLSWNKDKSKEILNASSYKISDASRPQFVVNAKEVDLGDVNVKEEKDTTFEISNSGSVPLVIGGINTSCMCTFAKIVQDGKESVLFGMSGHNDFASSETFTINPGSKVSLVAIYRPYLMPVQGPVERYVFMQTNDPANPQVQLKFKANVN